MDSKLRCDKSIPFHLKRLAMPYITNSSLSRIFKTIILEDVPDSYISKVGKIWPRTIPQLSWRETKSLLLWKVIYRNPEGIESIYNKSSKTDTYTYLDEARASSYHISRHCPFLNSGFKTYVIPDYIRQRGPNEVKSFRSWYKLNINRLGGAYGIHTDFFFQEMKTIFGEPDETADTRENLEQEDVPNIEEPQEQKNLDLGQLTSRIDEAIDNLLYFYNSQNPITQQVLRHFAKASRLGYSPNPILNNTTGFSDDRLKQFLKQYHDKYKQPLIDDLRDYYKVYFNPELDFKGRLLDELNFKPCSYCYP
ncbi:hypothetical protein [Hymenobacter psychrotolerans]|nr:hypothetical protein [Hymenobacter psychrotolerans]